MSAPVLPQMRGPGILYVISKIASSDLNEESYIKWYEDDHIAEIMLTSGIKSALRYKSIDANVDKPFMVMYPMEDIGFTQGEEFKNIKVFSDLLPGGGPIYDLADIDVRYYQLVHIYDPKGPTKEGKVKAVLTAAVAPGPEISEQEFDDWYRKEHLDLIANTVPGFLRTTRYKLVYYRTNAQSRALKGLPARQADNAIKQPPPFFAVHEFETDDVDIDALIKTNETDWAKKILSSATTAEGNVWALKGSFGEKRFFQ